MLKSLLNIEPKLSYVILSPALVTILLICSFVVSLREELINTISMKNIFLFCLALVGFAATAQTYEFKIVTAVESVVPSGMGRSRLISTNEDRNYKDFTTTRSEEGDERNKSDRDEIRVKGFDETKLLNFFNIAGIRFQNIAANDALITSKLNAMSEEGWELAFVTSGVESNSGKEDSTGLFITRFVFKRLKK